MLGLRARGLCGHLVAAIVGAQRAAPETATHYPFLIGEVVRCALHVCRGFATLAGRWAQHAAGLSKLRMAEKAEAD